MKYNLIQYLMSTFITAILSLLLTRYVIHITNVKQYSDIILFSVSLTIFTSILSLSLNRYIEKIIDDKDSLLVISKLSLLFSFTIGFILIMIFNALNLYVYSISVFVAIFESMFVFLTSYYGYKLQSKSVVSMLIFKSILMYLSYYIVSKHMNDLFLGYVFCYLFSLLVILSFNFKKFIALIRVKLDFNTCKIGLYFSIPLIFHMISSSMMNNFDRIQMANFYDHNVVVLYSSAYLIISFYILFMTALNQNYAPIYYKYKGKNDEYLKKTRTDYLKLIWFVSLIMVCFGEFFATILIGNKYSQGFVLIPYLSFIYVFYFHNILYCTTLLYYQKTLRLTIHSLIGVFINVILNLILMNYFGYEIAVATTGIALITWMLLNYSYAKKLDKDVNLFLDLKENSWFILIILCFSNSYLLKISIIFILMYRYKIISLIKRCIC